MDQAAIQAKVNLGYGKAARYLGAPFQQYRPTDPLNPLATIVGSIMADFDIDPLFSHKAPGKYGNPVYYGLFDATSVQAGDYLTNTGLQQIFAVAGMEPNKPPLCIACNDVLSVYRPNTTPVGDRFYGGDMRGNEAAVMLGWPGSLLQGVRGEKGPTNLPGDTRMPWANILMASFSGITLQVNDRIEDGLGRSWNISSAELTNLGWRLTAALAGN